MNTDTRARIRAGDPSAFAELFDSHARSVYNHAFRLTGDWSVAEDVMAATYLEAWRLRQKVDPEGDRSGRGSWASPPTSPATTAGATGATAGPPPRTPRPERPTPRCPTTPPRWRAGLDDRRRIAATLRALGTLRRSEREVLVLCLWEGLAYTEVAAALGVPVGTVRSRLSRARAKLRTGAEEELAREMREVREVREIREPAPRIRQTTGDRMNAVRPAQEGTR